MSLPSKLATFAAAAGALTLTISAQTLFEENFDAGFDGWTTQSTANGWHWVGDWETCGSLAAPFPSSRGAMRFGDVNCQFNFNWFGTLSMTNEVQVPANVIGAYLTFMSYDDVECGSCMYDRRLIYVSNDGGQNWVEVGESTQLGTWHQVDVDLTAYVGQGILVRFHFDAEDFGFNNGLGWLIDDVSVIAGECGPFVGTECEAYSNSFSNDGAHAWYSGSLSVAASDLVLTVEDGPPGEFAHFIYGADAGFTIIPNAWGPLCVGTGSPIVRLLPSQSFDSTGFLQRPFDAGASSSTPNHVQPGTTWRFQLWFRDPTWNKPSSFSDVLRVTFCP